MQIGSLQNPKIKNLLKLQQKSRERKIQERFVVEGIQENKLAIDAGYEPIEFFIEPTIFKNSINLPAVCIYHLTHQLFEKIAYRGTTEGVLGIYKTTSKRIEEVSLAKNALVLVLESVEKPGNLGAILRSCDGGGVDLLVVCDPLVDFYNPNVIRSSVGTVFTNQKIVMEKEKVVEWLKREKTQIVSTFLRKDTLSIFEIDLNRSTAIVLGTEAEGLSDFWLENSDVLTKIPMLGMVDSLNVSNAAAICIYETLRQKS